MKYISVMACLAISFLSGAIVRAATIEQVMRDIQSRRTTAGLSAYAWPAANGSGQQPGDYPPDHFYDLENSTDLANAFNAAITQCVNPTVYQRFLNNDSFGSLTSGTQIVDSNPLTYTSSTIQFPNDSVSPPSSSAGADSVIGQLQANLARLKWLSNNTSSMSANPLRSGNSWLDFNNTRTDVNGCASWAGGQYAIAGCTVHVVCEVGSSSCNDQLRQQGINLVLSQPGHVATTTSGWTSGTLQASGTRSNVIIDGGHDCTNVSTCYLFGAGTLESSSTYHFWGSLTSTSVSFHADLSAYCGDVDIYVKGSGHASWLPFALDNNYRYWKTIHAGTATDWAVGPTANPTENDSGQVLGYLTFFRGCFAGMPSPLSTGANTPPAALAPIGTLVDGNFSVDCPDRLSTHPVNLATGIKSERSVDVDVPARGGAIQLVREYTSDLDYLAIGSADAIGAAGNLMGRGWTGLEYRQIKEIAGVPTLIGPPFQYYLAFHSVGSGLYSAGGAATQTLSQATLSINSVLVNSVVSFSCPVWRLAEPGQWEQDFIRSGTGVDARLVGLLLQERDNYGNSRTYRYAMGALDQPRLAAIYVNAASTGDPAASADAQILFSWKSSGGTSAGKLQNAVVHKRVDPGTGYKEIQRVEYTYASDISGSSDLGSGADLVQVKQIQLVSSSTAPDQYYKTITQYRYHDGNARTSSDERLAVVGAAGQIKCIILPQQIEYYAQKIAAENSWSPDQALDSAAADLLSKSDSQTISSSVGQSLTVIDLASKVIGYSASNQGRKVIKEILQADCGCSGAANGVKLDHTYWSEYAVGSETWLSARIEERRATGSSPGQYESTPYRVKYYDLRKIDGIPYLENRATRDPATGSIWVERTEYDDGPTHAHTVKRTLWPSATASYSPVDSSGGLTWSPVTNGGRFETFSYNSDNRVIQRSVGTFVSGSSASDLVEEITYPTSGFTHLPQTIKEYSTAGQSSANFVEETDFFYGFYSGSKIAWTHTTTERESVGENGPNSPSTVSRYDLIDRYGLGRWSRAEDGSATYRDFDLATGVATRVIRNANPVAPGGDSSNALQSVDYAGLDVSLWGRSAQGGELTTVTKIDEQGRVIETITPPGDTPTNPGVSTYVVRSRETCPRRAGLTYLRQTVLPHHIAGSSPVEFNGPASVTWLDAAGAAIATSEFEIDGSQSYDPRSGVFTLGAELSRSSINQSHLGLVTGRTKWHDVANDGSYTTQYSYDSLGRLSTTTTPTSTIHRVAYDVLDRITAEYTAVGSSEQLITEYGYDTGTSGVGDGNLTLIRQHTGETSGSSEVVRDTVRYFDTRDRMFKVVNPDAPHQYFVFDNLERLTK